MRDRRPSSPRVSPAGSGHDAGYAYALEQGWTQEDIDEYRAAHPNNTSFAEGAERFVTEIAETDATPVDESEQVLDINAATTPVDESQTTLELDEGVQT